MSKEKLLFYGKTDIGRQRSNNEDAFVAEHLESHVILAVVIDGVGGYEGGEVAAEIAQKNIPAYLKEFNRGERLELLKQAVVSANNAIYEQRQTEAARDSMSCVLTAAIVDADLKVVDMVHVGDTRMYQFRHGKLKKLSHDHSLIGYREEIGDLTEEQAMNHPQRNVISRDVGSAHHEVEDKDFLESERFPLLPNSIFLLCSDGLTDLITANQIVTILEQQNSLEKKAQMLIDAANKAGGKDNVTVVLVEYQPEEIPQSFIESTDLKQNKIYNKNFSQIKNNTQIENQEQGHKKSLIEKIKESRGYRVFNTMASSAILCLMITFFIFFYKLYFGKQQFRETVDRLENISQSLSTRCLGEFPDYISEINDVFAELQPEDTVIIFEDVLYYGAVSKSSEFARLQQLLLDHANQGGSVTVVYYDNHHETKDPMAFPWNTVFHKMIMEERIADKYIPEIKVKHREAMKKYAEQEGGSPKESKQMFDMAVYFDSCFTEEFYRLTVNDNIDEAKKSVDEYMHSEFFDKDATQTNAIVKNLCDSITEIKQKYLMNGEERKKLQEIHFFDFKNMYSEITDKIIEIYNFHNINLVPINEYLTMSCWLIKPVNPNRPPQAIIAFPSKYSTSEIGFYSQDHLFSEYITTMLNGIRNNNDIETSSHD